MMSTVLFVNFLLSFHIIVTAAQNKPSCSRGTFRSSNGSCILCSPGTYSNGTNLSGCFPCPKDTFFSLTGAQTETACRRCPIDATSAPGSSTCTSCQPGFVSTGMDECVRCPPGTQVGRFYISDTNNSINGCYPCSPSWYSDTFNAKTCKRCPEGSISKEGSTSITDCKKCPPGFGPMTTTCEPCTSGSYFDGIPPVLSTYRAVSNTIAKYCISFCNTCIVLQRQLTRNTIAIPQPFAIRIAILSIAAIRIPIQ